MSRRVPSLILRGWGEKTFSGPFNVCICRNAWILVVCDLHFSPPLKCYIKCCQSVWLFEVSAGFTSLSCCYLSGMPRFTSQPSATTVYLGNSQVMACEVNSDLVPFTRWEKDRQPLELSTRLVQLPSGALVISNASEADAGLYRCLVENVGSSKSSDEAQLQILPGNLRK